MIKYDLLYFKDLKASASVFGGERKNANLNTNQPKNQPFIVHGTIVRDGKGSKVSYNHF